MRALLRVGLVVVTLGTMVGCLNQQDDTYAVCNTLCNHHDQRCIIVDIATVGTSGRYCSLACTRDEDCPGKFGFSGACFAIESNPAQCYQRCTTGSDCWTTSVCVQLKLPHGETDFVCVPDDEGPRAL